jgi:hypothetical protein
MPRNSAAATSCSSALTESRILAVLIAGGLFVLIKAPSYSSEKSVFKIGGR